MYFHILKAQQSKLLLKLKVNVNIIQTITF